MNKHLTLLLFIGLAWGQENSGLDIITMKSGEVYKGEIVFSSFNKVSLKKEDDGKTIELSRSDIEIVSTPVSRGEIAININVKSDYPEVNHLKEAGRKLENFVIFSLTGTFMSWAGVYLIVQSGADGESNPTGNILFASGYLLQLAGFFQIGDAGEELRKASAQRKVKDKND